MYTQKTVAAVHDLSGMGKCSLTAAIPVLSAAGISVSVLPTAILSTQTGGLNEYTYRDLTADMRPFMNHWKNIGVKFNAVYSGFLGSSEQVEIVSDFVDDFSMPDSVFLCDPAMADNGKLYDTFDDDFVDSMKKLCRKADIIVPNFTEAAMLLSVPYKEPPYDREYVENILYSLEREFSVKYVVLTGVAFDSSEVGCASLDASTGEISYALSQRIDGMFHSTGDLFASSLLGAVLSGFSVAKASAVAINFTVSAIKNTVMAGGDSRFGLSFEKCLPVYMKDLEII